MLTYVYGVVVLSLCRNRWGCGSSRKQAGELSTVELENLAKLNELLAVLPTPMVPEKGASAFIPHSSNSQHEEPCQKDRKSESASTVALAGSMLSEAQEISHRSV
uniref:Uncharacterized protein n=1 Tax=Micrurus paraensis TaxID=1970185 RepID=A0A2D4L2E2_9SAUR